MRRRFDCLAGWILLYLAIGWLGAAAVSVAASPTDRLAPGSEEVQVFVELEDRPAAAVFSRALERAGQAGASRQQARIEAVRETQSHLAQLEMAQGSFLAALEASRLPARTVFALQRVGNGFALRLPASHLVELETLPGVVRVLHMAPKHSTNSTTVPFVGTPEVWEGSILPGMGGLTGAGMRIGIVDTGIDYLHVDFGGSGLASDYAANDTTLLDGFFPSSKVAGGFDFVGDAYDASSSDPGNSLPTPDPDPMDCDGHGTHVAGTAAGLGVTGSGSTFAGTYDTSVDFASLRIGPGVAPEATLFALRVFGCAGTSNVVEQALEWAVDPNGDGDFSDRLDVLNLSLASRYGGAEDPTSVAADMAVAAGVVVVASAGNDGDVSFVVGAPAAAAAAISVASVWDSDLSFPTRGIRISSPSSLAGTYRTLGANFGPGLPMPISGQVVATEPADACVPLSNGAEVMGRIALVQRGGACGDVARIRHAQDAGAVAVAVVNDGEELLSGIFDDGTGGDITVPPVLVHRRIGLEISEALATQTVDMEIAQVPLGDTLALNSSRGPRRQDVAPAPDVAAPGVLVTSAAVGDSGSGGTASRLLSGTSMAAPHVAGLAALLRQRHPEWTPSDIKTALINTSKDVFFDPEETSPRHGANRVGGGRIRVPEALAARALARSVEHPERVSVSFGHLEVLETETREQTVLVENRGTFALVYTPSIDVVADLPGLDLSLLDRDPVALAPGESAEVRVGLEARAADLRHSRDPTQEATLFGFPRFWQGEETAFLLLEPTVGGGPSIRVPITVSARPASRTGALGPLEVGSIESGEATLTLAGIDVDTGNTPPLEERSLVSVLELQHDDGGSGDPLSPDFIGVTSNAPSVGLGEAVVYFGLALGEDISTPNEVLVEVLLDVGADGDDDFALSSSDWGTFTFGGFATDGFISVLRDLDTQAESVQLPLEILGSAGFHTVPFHTNIRLLGVRAAALGLESVGGELAYRVRLSASIGGSSVALEPGAVEGAPGSRWLPFGGARPMVGRSFLSESYSFDAETPGVSSSGLVVGGGVGASPIHFDSDGASIIVAYDLGALARHGSSGALLLHHHGLRGERAEIVGLQGNFPDLEVSQVALVEPVAPGGLQTYRISVRNAGPELALGVGLENSLAAEVESFEPAQSDPTCQLMSPENVECELGDLASGEARSIEITLRLRADLLPAGCEPGGMGGCLENRVQVALGEGLEANLLNNRSVVRTPISWVVPHVEKSVMGTMEEGGAVTYLLAVENRGSFDQPDLSGPELVDVLPAELEPRTVVASAGEALLGPGGVLTWSGPLSVGGPATLIEVVAIVRDGAAGSAIVNQAEVFYDGDLDGELGGAADGSVGSDDPSTPVPRDPTVFVATVGALEIPLMSWVGLMALGLLLITAAVWRLR